MFNFGVRGRRVGRIAFGAVLLVGAGVLIRRLGMHSGTGWAFLPVAHANAAIVITTSWATAFLAYVVAGWLGSRRPIRDADELASAALVVPSVGVALLAPLTLHLPFSLLLWGGDSFDSWAWLGILATGPAHILLAVLVANRALRLAAGERTGSVWRIYWLTVAVSCAPFGFLVLPPLLVAVTGLPIVGIMPWMESIATRERNTPMIPVIPVAIARRA